MSGKVRDVCGLQTPQSALHDSLADHRLSLHQFELHHIFLSSLYDLFKMAEPPSTSQPPDNDIEPGLDQSLDGALDADIDMNLAPQTDTQPQDAPAEVIPEPPPAPTKKDITLREFLGKMDDYAPIV